MMYSAWMLSYPTIKGHNMKIALYAICKDEQTNIIDFLSMATEADEVVLLDTGSSDETPQLIQKFIAANPEVNVKYEEVILEPFRFDLARNIALGHVSKDVEYSVYADLDERFVSSWCTLLRQTISAAEGMGMQPDAVQFEMQFSKDESGNTASSYFQTRCHKTKDYTWAYPCHEVLMGPDLEVIRSPNITVEHLRDDEKERDYLDLLILGAEEYKDQRAYYYLAREYFYLERYHDAIVNFQYAMNSTEMHWDAQSAQAHSFTAQCYWHLDQTNLAEIWYMGAITTLPTSPDHWFDLAYFYQQMGQWELCAGHAKRALEAAAEPSANSNFLIRDLSKWTWQPHDTLAMAYWKMGHMPLYVKHSVEAYKINPDNSRLIDNFNEAMKLVKIQGENDDNTE